MKPAFLEAIAKLADALAWPIIALIVGALLVYKLPSIADAVKRAPMIRKIGFQGFEIELDLANLDELQQQTDKTLIALVQKSDKEIQRIVRASGLSDCLQNLGNYLYKKVPSRTSQEKADSALRCTFHIPDAVFSEYLYQACNYYHPWTQIHQSNPRTSGRRFSIRYGIIGLAARTRKTQIVGNALRGDEEQVRNLVSHWSMMPGEAESAKSKPSCLAIVLTDPETSAFLGVFYADSRLEEFFGTESQSRRFRNSLEGSKEFKNLVAASQSVNKALTQIEIAIDLNEIENLRA